MAAKILTLTLVCAMRYRGIGGVLRNNLDDDVVMDVGLLSWYLKDKKKA